MHSIMKDKFYFGIIVGYYPNSTFLKLQSLNIAFYKKELLKLVSSKSDYVKLVL